MIRAIRWATLTVLTSLLAACGSGGGGGGGTATSSPGPEDGGSGSKQKAQPTPAIPDNGIARLTVEQITEIHRQLLAEFQKSALKGSDWIHIAGWRMDQLLTSVGQVGAEDLESLRGQKLFFYLYHLLHEEDGSVRLSIDAPQIQKLLEIENLNLGGS